MAFRVLGEVRNGDGADTETIGLACSFNGDTGAGKTHMICTGLAAEKTCHNGHGFIGIGKTHRGQGFQLGAGNVLHDDAPLLYRMMMLFVIAHDIKVIIAATGDETDEVDIIAWSGRACCSADCICIITERRYKL